MGHILHRWYLHQLCELFRESGARRAGHAGHRLHGPCFSRLLVPCLQQFADSGSLSGAIGDDSAAQVGVVGNQLVLSKKTNAIETVNLNSEGAIVGATKSVANIPANLNAPFGLATRGDDAYVTIAHANELSLVRDDAMLTVTSSGSQSAPCWVTLDGPFLLSVNAASHTVSRYAVYGQKVIQDVPVVVTINGAPTDIV
jgi:hypothetical protein